MTAVVRNLFRTTTVDAEPANAEPVDYCECNRGPVIGAVIAYADKLVFFPLSNKKAEWPDNVVYLRCVDCLTDASLDVANGVVRERMREIGRQRDEQWAALQRQNEMRKAAGLPIVQTSIIPEGNEWPANGLVGGGDR